MMNKIFYANTVETHWIAINLGETHWIAIKLKLRYLKGSLKLCLKFERCDEGIILEIF